MGNPAHLFRTVEGEEWRPQLSFFSAIFYPWLDIGLPPGCPHCSVIERRRSHFQSQAGSGQDELTECDQPGKNPEILRRGWEFNPGYRKDRQWAITLSYHDPGHREDRQWAIPLSYHNPGHREDRQWAISLSYHDWPPSSVTPVLIGFPTVSFLHSCWLMDKLLVRLR